MITIRPAVAEDRAAIDSLYIESQYRGVWSMRDRIFVADDAGMLVGVIRLVDEAGLLSLRGMQVRSDRRRQGVGSALLSALLATTDKRGCYGLIYTQLADLFIQAGFAPVDESRAPGFFQQRIKGYRNGGKEFLMLYHPGAKVPG